MLHLPSKHQTDFSCKKKFGEGIGTTKLTRFRKEIAIESKNGPINGNENDMGSEKVLKLISTNRKLLRIAKEERSVIDMFINLFLELSNIVAVEPDYHIDFDTYNAKVKHHLDYEIIKKYMPKEVAQNE